MFWGFFRIHSGLVYNNIQKGNHLGRERIQFLICQQKKTMLFFLWVLILRKITKMEGAFLQIILFICVQTVLYCAAHTGFLLIIALVLSTKRMADI